MRTREAILDELLVLRCQSGEAAALALLARRWHPRFLRLAQRILGARGPATDVVQDAWIAIVRGGLQKLEDPASWRSWAYRIVSNKAHDWIRREKTRRRWMEKRDPEDLPPVGTSGCDEDLRALRSALRGLEPERRTMVEMFYSEGMTVAEIAVALGIPSGDQIDDMIRAALDEEETEFFDTLGEQSLPAMAFEVFRGRSRWTSLIGMVAGSVLLVLGVLAAWRFYHSSELRQFMLWGAAAAFCFSSIWAMKVWYWMEMQRHAITREIKRVELQLAHLVSRRA